MSARAIGGLRVLLPAVAAAGLVAAVLGGLARVGWAVPGGGAQSAFHGPLLVFGVFATLIGLERAAALGAGWAYAAPISTAMAALALLVQAHQPAALLALAGAVGLVVVNGAVIRRHASMSTWLTCLGSIVLTVSAIVWGGHTPVFLVTPAWIAFFVLTIVAERLGALRLAAPPRWGLWLLGLAAALLAVTSVAAIAGGEPARRLFGAALMAMAGWLLRFDPAPRLIGQPGRPRFVAAGVLAAAVWLGVAGVAFARGGVPSAGPRYDAAIHAVFIGFVLSMVMTHAPIILSTALRPAVPVHLAWYVPLACLHLSLAVRVAADWTDHEALRRFGALGNACALLLLLVGGVLFARAVRRQARYNLRYGCQGRAGAAGDTHLQEAVGRGSRAARAARTAARVPAR